jgi:hypothetical protein
MLLPGRHEALEWQLANEPQAVKRLAKKLVRQAPGEVHCCYEAGPCGYALQRRIRAVGVMCQVVAISGFMICVSIQNLCEAWIESSCSAALTDKDDPHLKFVGESLAFFCPDEFSARLSRQSLRNDAGSHYRDLMYSSGERRERQC